MTNKMILRQFSFFLAPASHFYRKFFLLNDTKILGCGRESVYIGLTSTRAAHRVCPAEGKLQIKRDRKRFLFTRQRNKTKLKQQVTIKNLPQNTYHFCSFRPLNIRLLPLSSGSWRVKFVRATRWVAKTKSDHPLTGFELFCANFLPHGCPKLFFCKTPLHSLTLYKKTV